jgi:thymidylate kinase
VKKILLTLSGTHGSGKSTNAGKCYYLLNRSGYKFSYIRHQDLLDPFGFIVRRTARILHVEPSKLESLRPTRVAWSLYLLLIYCPILVGGIRLRHLLGYNVVSDRYLYDMMVGFRDNGMTVPSELLLMRLLPHPDISFVFDAPEERILMDRPEHTAEFIRKEQFLYRQVAEELHLVKVNTSDPAPIVWNHLLVQIKTVFQDSVPAESVILQQVIN